VRPKGANGVKVLLGGRRGKNIIRDRKNGGVPGKKSVPSAARKVLYQPIKEGENKGTRHDAIKKKLSLRWRSNRAE